MDRRNQRLLNYFYQLHTARNKEFPGAWQAAFDTVDIAVESKAEARYYLRAWDIIFAAISDILHRRAQQESERRAREMDNRKSLRIYR